MSDGLIIMTNATVSPRELHSLRIPLDTPRDSIGDMYAECLCCLNATASQFSPFFGYYYWLRDDESSIPYCINFDCDDWKKSTAGSSYFTQDRLDQIKNGYKWIYSLVSEIINKGYDVGLFIGHLEKHELFNKEEELKVDKLLEFSTTFENATLYKIVK